MPELTQHAEARMQQRGVQMATLDWLLDYGAKTHDHHGATVVYFDKKAKSRLLKASGPEQLRVMEKQLNAYAVVASDGAVVTVGRRHRRIRRG